MKEKLQYEEREEFFERYGLKCTCLIGYVVCENCFNYYNTKGWKENIVDESTRYHIMCARATLFPGKSIEEVNKIIDKLLSHDKKIRKNSKYLS